MSLHRRNPRRDANEAAVIAALEAIGCQCYRVSGTGVPDLLVHKGAAWVPLEIKMPGGKLTKAQVKTRAVSWYPVVSSVQEALELFHVKAPR